MCNGIEIGRARESEREGQLETYVEVYVLSVLATAFYLPRFLFIFSRSLSFFFFFGVQLGVFTDFSWFFDFLTRVRRQSL